MFRPRSDGLDDTARKRKKFLDICLTIETKNIKQLFVRWTRLYRDERNKFLYIYLFKNQDGGDPTERQ